MPVEFMHTHRSTRKNVGDNNLVRMLQPLPFSCYNNRKIRGREERGEGGEGGNDYNFSQRLTVSSSRRAS